MPNIVDPTIPNFPPQGIQAQLDLLYLYNPDVAQKLIDQLNAGLIKMEELEKELEKALQDLQGVLRYKGSVETEADLPTEGNVIGDVWNITSTDENVAWNGTSWDKFGSGIDVSVFLTKIDAANTYATKQEVAAVLPEQTGNAGKFLTTNGTDVSWETVDAGVTSVNTKTGDVVLTGADINATLTGTGDPVTTTVTEHLQTLKNDETELGNQVSNIQALIPSDASETNLLATKGDIPAPELPTQEGNAGKFLTTNGTDASWAEVQADSLPDQAGHGGKFLTTDGTTASWNYPYTVGGATYGPSVAGLGSEVILGGSDNFSLFVGLNAKKSYSSVSSGTAIGVGTSVGGSCTAIGSRAKAGGTVGSNNTVDCIAIGSGAQAIGSNSIQIGYGTNNDDGTFKAWSYKLLDKTNGLIPSERLAADGTTGQVLSKTDTGMQWVDMSGGVSEIFHDDSLSGKGTETEPLSVARPAAIIREW